MIIISNRYANIDLSYFDLVPPVPVGALGDMNLFACLITGCSTPKLTPIYSRSLRNVIYDIALLYDFIC